MRIFLILLSITFLNPKVSVGFLFSAKNSPTWVMKCEKLNIRKSQVIYRISFENIIVHEWNSHLEIFSRLQVIENSR